MREKPAIELEFVHLIFTFIMQKYLIFWVCSNNKMWQSILLAIAKNTDKFKQN